MVYILVHLIKTLCFDYFLVSVVFNTEVQRLSQWKYLGSARGRFIVGELVVVIDGLFRSEIGHRHEILTQYDWLSTVVFFLCNLD